MIKWLIRNFTVSDNFGTHFDWVTPLVIGGYLVIVVATPILLIAIRNKSCG